jgi:hypothetical protein
MTMDDDTIVFPPVEPAPDKVYRLAEALTSLIPAGQSVLHSLISPPIHNRLEAWISKVETRLVELESKGLINYQELSKRQEFSALVIKTVQAVAVTSQQEKLRGLENFLMNVAMNPNLEEDELYILHNAISEFTPSHIKVLEFYARPILYLQGVKHMFEQKMPPRTKTPQGWELSHVFGYGDMEYWQNIFWMVSAHQVLTNKESRVSPGSISSPPLHGSVTPLGEKLLSIIDSGQQAD